jgi:hypothetical protein
VCDETAAPEFQSAYHDYEREMFSTIDRQMPRLLVATIRALGKMLHHKDWRRGLPQSRFDSPPATELGTQRRRSFSGAQWDRECERGALAYLTLDPDPAAVKFYELPTQGESQAGAF